MGKNTEDVPSYSEWRKNMAAALKRPGMDQTKLGHRLGVSQTVISTYKTGRTNSDDYLIWGISRELGIESPFDHATRSLFRWRDAGAALAKAMPTLFGQMLSIAEAAALDASKDA